MKIKKILKNNFSISFEFFPPKSEEGEKDLFRNLKSLEAIKPSFVSVTYGAGGSTRDKTRRIVSLIAREEKINVLAHLACIGHTKEEMLKIVGSYHNNGIENILALRGDTPAGSDIRPEKGELPHAVNLILFIRENFSDYFSIGGAVFPERHPESPNWKWEMKYFKEKTEAGLDFAITQLFFNNQSFYDLVERCLRYDIKIPIIPGIMPITDFKQIQKFAAMCHASIPSKLTDKLEKLSARSDDVAKAGIEYAIRQCEDLLANNVKGLHFYTLNKSMATLSIYNAISGKIPIRLSNLAD